MANIEKIWQIGRSDKTKISRWSKIIENLKNLNFGKTYKNQDLRSPEAAYQTQSYQEGAQSSSKFTNTFSFSISTANCQFGLIDAVFRRAQTFR